MLDILDDAFALTNIKQVSSKVLSYLRELDEKDLFGTPVLEQLPGIEDEYLQVVSHPMDFRTIEEKRMIQYSTTTDLRKDLELIFHNCIKFNGPTSVFGVIAQKMLKSLDHAIKDATMSRRESDVIRQPQQRDWELWRRNRFLEEPSKPSADSELEDAESHSSRNEQTSEIDEGRRRRQQQIPEVSPQAPQQPRKWEDIMQLPGTNTMSEADKVRVRQFIEDRHNPTPNQMMYKMKIHVSYDYDPTGVRRSKNAFDLELDYRTFTYKLTQKSKHF
ncbi:bromodomain containing protein [Nitzschia inconspicua]|uniref:Bromodomain containing protein n=1 Tax=Nitzschia inconspicua TaxID=303405 RepID=A0A9K3Q4V8_9STRA|nr:bromodomain containing protein [Nitzschia inconspicua]